MLLYNKSKCTQLVDSFSCAFPTSIAPGMVFEGNPFRNLLPEYFEEFHPFRLSKINTLLVSRKYALGDLFQLIPVMRYVKNHYRIQKIIIATSYGFIDVLKPIFPEFHWVSADNIEINKYDIGMNLDGLLEQDHSQTNHQNSQHRVDIYLQAFGLSHKCNSEDDWKPNVSLNLRQDILKEFKNMKRVGLQIRGSGYMKTLKKNHIKDIAYTLADKYQVVLLDQSKEEGFDGKNILNTCGRLSVMQCVALLQKLDCVITMDSGMLWMAHSANCPILTLLGPTREEERISLHPQYPQKAKAISISKELVGCSPCFETRANCKGKIHCMNDYDCDKLILKIKEKLSEIIGE